MNNIFLIIIFIIHNITDTNSFSLKYRTNYKRLDINYAITQNRVINTNQDYIKQNDLYNDINNNIRISLLSKNEIESAASMVCNVHYAPSMLLKIVKKMTEFNKKDYHLNNLYKKRIAEDKERLQQQIAENFARRAGDRLNSFDLREDQPSVIIVAKNQINEIVGLVEVWPKPYDNKQNIAYLCNLSVKKENRKQGVGTLLHKGIIISFHCHYNYRYHYYYYHYYHYYFHQSV